MIRSSRGLSLVDVIVGIALMLVMFMALFGILRASLAVSAEAKAKSAAIELASTQMEYMRGVSYDALGTVGGIPPGNIPQTATSTVDGIAYIVRTFVIYTDDAADGLAGSDTNFIPTDYKIGKVTVSYTVHEKTRSVTLVSNFVPPGIESSTGGGTLALHIVDAAGANLSDATVRIVNASTSPPVDLTTYSDADALVLIGAATSSQYQIFVSRAGYSSAQTYARTGQNVNPTPGYLTVVKDQTTSATFAIDLLSTLSLASYAPAVTSSFSDSFGDASNLASHPNIIVDDGDLLLAEDEFSGSARSIPISPSYLDGWGILSANLDTPSGTTAVVRVGTPSGTPLPDADLPGNSAGFSTFPVSLTEIATSTYPELTLLADLTTEATSTTPSVANWSLSYTVGPTPLPNVTFTLTGAKTIGTDASSAPIYKTVIPDTTGATGRVDKLLEWDAYNLALGSGTLIESCPTMPFALNANTTLPASLIIGSQTAHTLPIVVENTVGVPIYNAKVVLTRSGYAATLPTNACGTAFFNNLSAATYSAVTTAAGHATTTTPSIPVSGHTAPFTIVLP